jgi:hypothetical protein
MPKFPARLLGRPIPLLALAAAVAIGTFSGVGYAATRNSAKPAPTLATTISPYRTSASTSAWTSKSSATTAPLVWQPLTLLNGWQSAQSAGTGAPSYAVSAQGVVYLAGSLAKGNESEPAFRLPVGARPGYYDCFSIYSNESNAQEIAALHIYSNGEAYLQGISVQYFTSLSGVSYVVGH